MILFRIFRALSLIWLPVAIYMTLHAPLAFLMGFMLFATPSILLYAIARILRRFMVGAAPRRGRAGDGGTPAPSPVGMASRRGPLS